MRGVRAGLRGHRRRPRTPRPGNLRRDRWLAGLVGVIARCLRGRAGNRRIARKPQVPSKLAVSPDPGGEPLDQLDPLLHAPVPIQVSVAADAAPPAS